MLYYRPKLPPFEDDFYDIYHITTLCNNNYTSREDAFIQLKSELLPDTEIGKNVPEKVIGSNFPCNFPKMVQGLANINR